MFESSGEVLDYFKLFLVICSCVGGVWILRDTLDKYRRENASAISGVTLAFNKSINKMSDHLAKKIDLNREDIRDVSKKLSDHISKSNGD